MQYVHSIPLKKNTVLHILGGTTYQDQPENLQLGEMAEMADVATTICQVTIKKYEVVDAGIEGMKMCQTCLDPESSAYWKARKVSERNAPTTNALIRDRGNFLKKKKP